MYLVSTGSQDTYTWYVDTYVPGLHPRPPKKNRRPSTGSGSDTRTARQSLHNKVRVTTTASDEARAERCVCDCVRCQQPYTLGAAAARNILGAAAK